MTAVKVRAMVSHRESAWVQPPIELLHQAGEPIPHSWHLRRTLSQIVTGVTPEDCRTACPGYSAAIRFHPCSEILEVRHSSLRLVLAPFAAWSSTSPLAPSFNKREDALFLGPGGTGKSHLAQAIGQAAAIQQGWQSVVSRDLMVGKLRRLSGTTQAALQQLACLGNVADIAVLSLVFGQSEEKIHAPKQLLCLGTQRPAALEQARAL